MSRVAICTDSSALFPDGVATRLGVIVVPIAITVDGCRFDESEGTVEDFYGRLGGGAEVTTSQPSPWAFLTAYRHAAERGASEVVSIHLDARVSGTAGAAELAAREAPLPVRVVDTQTVSFGVGLCVRAAGEALAAGASAAEAAAAAAVAGSVVRNAFVAQDAPRGRLPASSGWSLLEFADGRATLEGACDGIPDAIEAISARVLDEQSPVRVAVGHAASSTEPAADALALSLEGMLHVLEVERYRVAAPVAAHTGPLSFGAFWWPSP